jgi:hypothetical protein
MVANNPSNVAIAMALGHKTPRPALEDIVLLSIGTGLTPTIISMDTTNWGIVQWLLNPFRKPDTPLLNILFDGVVESRRVDEQAYVEEALYTHKPEACAANGTRQLEGDSPVDPNSKGLRSWSCDGLD